MRLFTSHIVKCLCWLGLSTGNIIERRDFLVPATISKFQPEKRLPHHDHPCLFSGHSSSRNVAVTFQAFHPYKALLAIIVHFAGLSVILVLLGLAGTETSSLATDVRKRCVWLKAALYSLILGGAVDNQSLDALELIRMSVVSGMPLCGTESCSAFRLSEPMVLTCPSHI